MLSVIIPAFDESARLPPTLTTLRTWLDASGEDYEVIVVDDGSGDATCAVVDEAAAAWPRLRLLRLGVNTGKGAAVRAGMLAAVGDTRLFTDADLSTPIDELPKVRAHLSDGVGVAIGSRALAESRIAVRQRWYRELMGRTYNRLLQAVALPGVHDTQCGFKLFTADAAVACFEPLVSLRFGFDAEVLLRARLAGFRIAEVPVVWRHVDASRVHALRDSTVMLFDLWRLRRRLGRAVVGPDHTPAQHPSH